MEVIVIFLFSLSQLTTLVKAQGIYFPHEVPDFLNTLTPSRINTRISFGNDHICVNDFGERGECVFLRECPELQEVIRRNNGIRTVGDINFFRSRICRFVRRNAQLCCFPTTSPVIGEPDTIMIRPNSSSLLPPLSECGFTSVRRITDGVEYSHGSHPWLVGVGYLRTNGSMRILCGGTLVTRRHVLTAAHCFVRQPGIPPVTHVLLGEHSRSSNTERREPILLSIADRKSPGYNSISHINDIELLTLERDVEFTDFIKPACLPFELRRRNFVDEDMIIIGWGDTFHRSNQGNDLPLMAEVSGVSQPECRRAYQSEPQVPLDQTQLCADGGTRDACQGDSGGPLLYQDLQEHQRYFLIGIISFGVECANPAFPGVYTFIPEFLSWLTENINQ